MWNYVSNSTHVLTIAWLVLILPGPILTALKLRDAYRDDAACKRKAVNGLQRYLCHELVAIERLRFVQHLILVGTVLAVIPQIDLLDDLPAWPSIVGRYSAVVVVSALMGYSSLRARLVQRHIMRHFMDSD